MSDNVKKKIDSIRSSSSDKPYTVFGYPVYNIDAIDTRWKCIYCSLILKEPLQLTECGHRCCKGCFESRVVEVSNEQMICPDVECKTPFHKTEIMTDRAFKKELNVFPVTCYHKTDKDCPWTGLLETYQEHLDKEHVHYKCDLCDFQCSSYHLLNEHQLKECPARFRKCDLAPICSGEMIPIELFKDHLLTEKHQEAVALILSGQCDVPTIADQESDMESTTAESELEQEMIIKITELAETVQQLNDETVQLSREYIYLNEHYQVAVQEVNQFQQATNNRNAALTKLQPKQDEIQNEIDQLRDNFENQYISMDGTLTWKVDHLAERMSDAQSERQPSIYSPIFYSSQTGYKMQARLYLYGDGNARRTHISLFFLILKGEFDALLQWPFGYKVTFCLFDQTGNNRHIIDSFRPDVKSTSFQRPVSEKNVASGIPKFFPLPMIQQDDNPYVRDDTLFLKIMIDLNETPKMILPFMLTLNPGLPHHVQQNLINTEKAKKEQQQNDANVTILTQTNAMNS